MTGIKNNEYVHNYPRYLSCCRQLRDLAASAAGVGEGGDALLQIAGKLEHKLRTFSRKVHGHEEFLI
jgi:hypothetical protein